VPEKVAGATTTSAYAARATHGSSTSGTTRAPGAARTAGATRPAYAIAFAHKVVRRPFQDTRRKPYFFFAATFVDRAEAHPAVIVILAFVERSRASGAIRRSHAEQATNQENQSADAPHA
jgi:hypothetical protein